MTTTTTLLRRLARLVLVWYVLFVGVSVLAATLQPKTMEVVCSSMGLMKVVVQGEGGDAQVRLESVQNAVDQAKTAAKTAAAATEPPPGPSPS